ncbi:MAG: NAD(P)H-binding protein [Bdellovibrio sp.]|nr:NAD(P)H-binding protein [Bdellovibrio sp.]
MKNKVALVLGATGGIGGEVTRKLIESGWQVKALIRHKDSSPQIPGITWLQGDAMNSADVIRAAEHTDLIVHAVNPPGYKNWGDLVLPMIDNTILAAKKSGARILLPGTIYNYGAHAPALLSEDTPQEPTTRKGRIRKQLEEKLYHASTDGVRVLIVRCGDFYGPRPGNNWFSQGMITPGRTVKIITNPARKGVGHAWAYLPDVATTMVLLAEQEERLGSYETFHFGGNWDFDGKQMTAAISHAVGTPTKVRSAPWMLFATLSPFVVLFRELLEMRYLWQRPYQLDNRRLIEFLGHEPGTPLPQAVETTLRGLGCIRS